MLRHRTISQPFHIDEQGYEGVVMPAPKGSIAIVGQGVAEPRRDRAESLRRGGLGRLRARDSLAREQGDAGASCARSRREHGVQRRQELRAGRCSNFQGGLIVTIPEPFSPARESSG